MATQTIHFGCINALRQGICGVGVLAHRGARRAENQTAGEYAHPACGVRNGARRTRIEGGTARRGGFTLIEVLATLLLLSIALPVIMGGISLATHVASVSQRRSEAGALAESKLNELVATGQWQTGNLSGDFGTDSPAYSWAAEVNPWGQGVGVSASNVVQELDVHVLWQQGATQDSLTVSTLVYQSPTTSGSTSTSGGS